MKRLSATVFSALLLAGCGLPLEDQALPFENVCTESSQCGGQAMCVETPQGNACAATSSDLGAVYLEVRASDASDSATSFLFTDVLRLEGVAAGGFNVNVDLQLPPLVEVSGSYEGSPGTPADCMQAGTIPVKVELRAAVPLPGVQNQLTAISKLVDDKHEFKIDAPPGTYDVYIEPKEQADCVTSPPRFYPGGLVVPPDVAKINFAPRDAAPETLNVTITVPEGEPIVGWQLDVVDRVYGRSISNRIALEAPVGATIAVPPIPYSYSAGALVRLQRESTDFAEEEDKVDLTLHWQLDSLPSDGNGGVAINLRDLDAQPVALTATVVGPPNTGAIANAKVTIQSQNLSSNQNASSKLVVKSDETGGIEANLVPGTYLVSVVPSTPGVGIFFGDWIVNEDGAGNGKGFDLPVQPLLRADIRTVTGDSASNAPVLVAPSLAINDTYFDQVFGVFTPLPRQLTGTVAATGGLEMFVDAGTIDFSVQIAAETKFPWVVRPRLAVQDPRLAPEAANLDLGDITVPFPAIVTGTVRSPSGSAGLALVRAWVPAGPAEGEDGLTAPLVQIGSAIADDAGNFFLPLPPTVTKTE